MKTYKYKEMTRFQVGQAVAWAKFLEDGVFSIETPAGKSRVFYPGRLTKPQENALYSRFIIGSMVKFALSQWKEIYKTRLVGVPIMTEGGGYAFFHGILDILHNEYDVWLAYMWARRERIRTRNGDEAFDPFKAAPVAGNLEIFSAKADDVSVFLFDIIATGTTGVAVISYLKEHLGPRLKHIVYGSPCGSMVGARAIREAAGDTPCMCLLSEGAFGLYENGTYLSLQLEGAYTSEANLEMSRTVYPDPRFCHIGAGGRAAASYRLYRDELEEEKLDLGLKGPAVKLHSPKEWETAWETGVFACYR
jgi:hypothetical protein